VAPISERRIEVDGVGIFVREVAGDGPPVVFVHGNPTDSRDWVPFLERIDRPAIAFDLPGWGRSDRPPIDRPELVDRALDFVSG
jgi:pimeloyl-ACP methyl ester carboxylesterase